jgi:hypothetical protein
MILKENLQGFINTFYFILFYFILGNSKTAIICTINPSETFVDTTKSSLHFADLARKVKMHATVCIIFVLLNNLSRSMKY